MTQQANWRFCEHCNVMFYDGNPEKGRCLGSLLSGHVAQGFNFNLPYGDPESSTVQANWLCCSKCLAMFYDGSADKGHCAAGETHVASGSNFSLPHDVVETPTAQAAWRYCSLCSAMFFDGYANKGPCPGAATFRTNLGDHHGPHQSSGFDFVLPHGVGSQPGPPAGSIPVSLTGSVWVVSLTHTQAEWVEGSAGSAGGIIQLLSLAGGPIPAALGSAIAGALAIGSGLIQMMDSLGGDQGVDVQGVIGINGILVTPHASGIVAQLIEGARTGVSAVTIADFLIAAAAKDPAMSEGLGISGVAGVFNLVSSGNPLGWALAAGVGILIDFAKPTPDPNEHGGIHADRTKVDAWERFILSQVGPNNQVALLAWQGLFSAQNGGGDDVYANRPSLGPWETWTLVDNKDGTVSFMTQNGQYLNASDGGGNGSFCRANSPKIGDWERFILEQQANGHIALKTFARGTYLSVQSGK
jgi:hypothetical protein